jgi:hypothetical protein
VLGQAAPWRLRRSAISVWPRRVDQARGAAQLRSSTLRGGSIVQELNLGDSHPEIHFCRRSYHLTPAFPPDTCLSPMLARNFRAILEPGLSRRPAQTHLARFQLASLGTTNEVECPDPS